MSDRTLELDPHTKLCMYAERAEEPQRIRGHARAVAPARIPKRAVAAAPEQTVAEDLAKLARARRLSEWMYEQFTRHVRGSVMEVGAGIGTFSALMLERGADRLVLVEPDPGSADALERRFGGDRRVRVVREALPETTEIASERGQMDFVLCQNVLEHVDDEAAVVRAMAEMLRSGGAITLLVPAHPRLFGSLDRAYGHHRRYTRESLRSAMTAAGIEVEAIRSFNLLGVLGWWVSSLRGSGAIHSRSLAA